MIWIWVATPAIMVKNTGSVTLDEAAGCRQTHTRFSMCLGVASLASTGGVNEFGNGRVVMCLILIVALHNALVFHIDDIAVSFCHIAAAESAVRLTLRETELQADGTIVVLADVKYDNNVLGWPVCWLFPERLSYVGSGFPLAFDGRPELSGIPPEAKGTAGILDRHVVFAELNRGEIYSYRIVFLGAVNEDMAERLCMAERDPEWLESLGIECHYGLRLPNSSGWCLRQIFGERIVNIGSSFGSRPYTLWRSVISTQR